MTREEINELNVVEPNCFENNREEEWYKVGLKEGLKAADKSMIENACNWMRQQMYQEFAGAPFERLISDDLIDDFVKSMEE